MADSFALFISLNNGLPGIGPISQVFREVDCQQGRPDFIAIPLGRRRFLSGKPVNLKLAGSLLLSFLHEGAPRTATYLCERSGLAGRTVRNAAAELVALGYAKRTASGAYVANSSRSMRDVQVLAIELKLDRPRRAVFQAQQARAFAQRVLIVVPPSQEGLYERYSVALRRWGIGLATYDPETQAFALCRTPRASKPRSRQHQAYAAFQLLDDASRS